MQGSAVLPLLNLLADVVIVIAQQFAFRFSGVPVDMFQSLVKPAHACRA